MGFFTLLYFTNMKRNVDNERNLGHFLILLSQTQTDFSIFTSVPLSPTNEVIKLTCSHHLIIVVSYRSLSQMSCGFIKFLPSLFLALMLSSPFHLSKGHWGMLQSPPKILLSLQRRDEVIRPQMKCDMWASIDGWNWNHPLKIFEEIGSRSLL